MEDKVDFKRALGQMKSQTDVESEESDDDVFVPEPAPIERRYLCIPPVLEEWADIQKLAEGALYGEESYGKALVYCIEWIEELQPDRRPPGFILCGSVGTGKSALACACLIAHNEKRGGGWYQTAGQIVRFLRTSAAEEYRKRLVTTPLLVLDDYGAEYRSDWSDAELSEVLEERYAEMRPTILTSNLMEAGLEKALDGRTWDRLAGERTGGQVLEIKGESRR